MKVLILTDLYQLWINFKFYAVFIVVALGIAAFSNGDSDLGFFFPMYAVLMCSMMGMSIVQLDEASRWNICAQTLPCSRRDQVTGKYIVTMASFAATWLPFVLLYAVLAVLGRMAWQTIAVQSVLLLIVGLLAPAFSMPPLFRWGAARGRVIYIFLVILMAAGIGGLASGLATLDLFALPALPMPLLAVLAVVIPAALFMGSWALSVKWYDKREL